MSELSEAILLRQPLKQKDRTIIQFISMLSSHLLTCIIMLNCPSVLAVGAVQHLGTRWGTCFSAEGTHRTLLRDTTLHDTRCRADTRRLVLHVRPHLTGKARFTESRQTMANTLQKTKPPSPAQRKVTVDLIS